MASFGMSSLSKIFDSIKINLHSAEYRENIKPVQFIGVETGSSMFIHLVNGHFFNEAERDPMPVHSFYFRPAGSLVDLRIGKSAEYKVYTPEMGLPTPEERNTFQRILNPLEELPSRGEIFGIVIFEVLLHHTFHLFKILQLPRIPLPFDEELADLTLELCKEQHDDKLGRERLLKNYTEELVIRIFRYIASFPQYEKNLEKINFLSDKRLAAIVEYINENIGGDLTNKRLAQVCFLSEDYIGQFFKSLTNLSLQDFVENQRLEAALHKLNTTSESVAEIAFSVGFRDPAYFSRRFKMKYSANASSIRNSKSIFG